MPNGAAVASEGRRPVIMVIQWLRSGGAEKQLLLLSAGLAKRGWKVKVLTIGSGTRPQRLADLLDVAVSQGVSVAEGPGGPCGPAWVLRELLIQPFFGNPPALWSWGARAAAICGAVAALRPRVWWIASLRSANPGRFHRFRWALRLASALGASFVSNSRAACELLSGQLADVSGRCGVIPNALAPGEDECPPVELPRRLDHLSVVVLGNIRPEKGYSDVLRLAARLAARGFPAKIAIGGLDKDGWLPREIVRKGLTDVVAHVGEVPEATPFLRSGHVFLLTSRSEGMPNALLEAMNMGLPCVATTVGDIATLGSDGINLRLVAPGDVDGLDTALTSILSDWPAAVAMARRGRAHVRTVHSQQAATDGAERLLRRANAV